MNKTGKDILIRFQKRCQLLLWLEVFLYAIGAAIFTWLISFHLLISIISFGIVFIVAAILKRPWEIDLQKVSSFIDSKSTKLEYSSGLLLKSTGELSGLAKLQQQKVTREVEAEIKQIEPEHKLETAAITSVIMIAIGFSAFYFGLTENYFSKENKIPKEEIIVFRPTDSSSGIAFSFEK